MLTDQDLHVISYNMCGSDCHFNRLKIWAKARRVYEEQLEKIVKGVRVDPFDYLNQFKIGIN